MSKTNLEESIFESVKKVIGSWNSDLVKEIYAISFFIYDDEDDCRRPTLTLGYNTETNYLDSIESAYDKDEARWNFAFWLHNKELIFGSDEISSEQVKKWIQEQDLYLTDEEVEWDESEKYFEYGEEITQKFVQTCVNVSKRLHTDGIIKNKFNKDIPIVIHELEYYNVIAKQTVEANPPKIADEFAEWIFSMYK